MFLKNKMNKTITVEVVISAPIKVVWDLWNTPSHIMVWMHASDDWECSRAVNELKVNGRFSYTLGAKDKSVSFDLSGTYTKVDEEKFIAYTLDDGRTVTVSFVLEKEGVRISETFEMEHENSEELQRSGWQSILNNFKAYTQQNRARM
jgi:uncharacterized protein YndB with AHSA1/START domain